MSTEVAEFLRAGASVAAVVMSALSLWVTGSLWRRANRPIVTAAVRVHSGGNEAIMYELAVINTGTRPATAVRLVADRSSVQGAMEPTALTNPSLTSFREEAFRCFSEQGLIPLLLNGHTATNAFGVTGNSAGGGSLWRVGATIHVEIAYSDIEGKAYKSQVTLRIHDTAGFAGSFWEEAR